MKKTSIKTAFVFALGVGSITGALQFTQVSPYANDKNQVVSSTENHYPFKLMPLPYQPNALEPYLDAKTVELHHDKHMQTYVDNLNKALEAHPKYHDWTLDMLLEQTNKLPKEIRQAVHNNAGGVYNHQIYFKSLAKDVPLVDGYLKDKIIETYGSIEQFQEALKTAALSVFGSGWAWLLSDDTGNLIIETTPNQDTLIKDDLIPVLALDVWEHAYYLGYQNRRDSYLDNLFNLINWEVAEAQYTQVLAPEQ